MMQSKNQLPDAHQSYWQLSVIQLAGWTSMPILATSILILQNNSFLGSALTIIVGNAIMWFLRLVIIYMSFEKRQSTLDLSRDYLGKLGGYCIAVLLLVSTFAWFLTQTTAASNALTHLLTIQENPQIDQFVQVSVFLGLVSTLLCLEGIVLLRIVSTIAFPIMLFAFLAILFVAPHHSLTNHNPLSLSGLTLVLATNLGITADIPTFFRHSNSWADSLKALTVVQIVIILVGLASLYFGAIINDMFEINAEFILQTHSDILRISLIVFIFVSAVLANIANVYSASVGWEILAPRTLLGRKEYLILGLGLTTSFILLSNIFDPILLLNLSDVALVNLCFALLCGFALTHYQKTPPTRPIQIACLIAWVLSTALNTAQLSTHFPTMPSPLLLSLIITSSITVFYLLTKNIIFQINRNNY